MRKDISGTHSPNSLQKSHSWSNIKEQDQKSPLNGRQFKFDNSLTVHVSSYKCFRFIFLLTISENTEQFHYKIH